MASNFSIKIQGLYKYIWPLAKPFVIPKLEDALNSIDDEDLKNFKENAKFAVGNWRGVPGEIRKVLCGKHDDKGNFITKGLIDEIPLEATVEATKQRILDYVRGL